MRHYEGAPCGSVRPEGHLKDYMAVDLAGFVGHLDQLSPQLFPGQDDIYGSQRRTGESKSVVRDDLGVVIDNPGMNAQLSWWNAETQGNWLDGLVRTAALLDDPQGREKALTWLSRYRATQDPDGYLGIYGPDLRYKSGRENGELWAQTALCRAMLGAYEAWGDPALLDCVVRAVDRTMAGFPQSEACRPFDNRQEPSDSYCTGIGHGLTFVDVCDTLARLTGEKKYLDYGVWLYRQFNREDGENLDRDVLLSTLLDPDYRMNAHGVHTYEQVRALILAAEQTGEEPFLRALEAYWAALDARYLCPSGAPIADESIAPQGYDPTVTAYEYCGLHELTHSLVRMLEYTGDLSYADRAEKLVYNGAMGAHLAGESAITYCKSDNCYRLTGESQCPQPHSHYNDFVQTRFKYSPTHQDVAACCVPNAGRLMPYFLSGMVLQDEGGFLKAVYGPSTFQGEWQGARVTLTEDSAYPFGTTLGFTLTVSRPVSFRLALRVPGWAQGVQVDGCPLVRERDVLALEQTWAGSTSFTVTFQSQPQVHRDRLGDCYVTYGPLVMCLDIPSTAQTVRTYPLEGFRDQYFVPVPGAKWDYALCTGAPLTLLPGALPQVRAILWDKSSGAKIPALLRPMAGTVLRRVTFPECK